MLWTLSGVGIAALAMSLVIVLRMKRLKDQSELEQHSITAEELHVLLASNREVLLFDVRQPLDLLAYPEIILNPGFWLTPSISGITRLV